MCALTESKMLVVLPVEHQRFRILKLRFVMVRRTQRREHEFTFWNFHTSNTEGFSGITFGRHQHRSREACQFFNRRFHQVGLCAQTLEVIWILEQRQRTIADQSDCGFVTGDQQNRDHRNQFVFTQA